MIRITTCIILLALSQVALAEKLYQWTEADGSITFSPEPPADGIDYKAIDSTSIAASNNTSQPSVVAPTEPAKPSILATSEHDVGRPQIPVNETPISTRPATAVARPLLNYAPELNSGITRSEPTEQDIAAVEAEKNDGSSTQTIASNKKRQQCEDLGKRVLSLERRLRADLEWDDMDNTIVAMARYQRSFDKFCHS